MAAPLGPTLTHTHRHRELRVLLLTPTLTPSQPEIKLDLSPVTTEHYHQLILSEAVPHDPAPASPGLAADWSDLALSLHTSALLCNEWK